MGTDADAEQWPTEHTEYTERTEEKTADLR
jgi:hypothetical protein